ncbi:MAG: hypothetical protein K6G17_08335 [Oscillospiraceae bacterium]|nr:hypothetical protein [Oscillospiraceae bacterium]
MRNTVKKKAASRAGFTLAEALITLLIVLMVSAIVAAGLPAAQRAYEKVVDGANAQLLLSTTVTCLREELGAAVEVEPAEDGKSVSYVSGVTGYPSVIGNSTEGIQVSRERPDASDTQTALLVTAQAATKGMTASFSSVSCSGGVVTISELTVKKGGRTLASLAKLQIRAIALPES